MPVERSIKEYLVSHGISQAFVARKCGWSRSKICDYLSGRRKLRPGEIESICAAIGLTLNDFK